MAFEIFLRLPCQTNGSTLETLSQRVLESFRNDSDGVEIRSKYLEYIRVIRKLSES